MKKKILIPCLIIFSINFSVVSGSVIYFRFQNEQYLNNFTQFQFDVEFRANTDTICLRDMGVYFNYNPDQFGDSIENNGNISYTMIGIMSDPGVPGNPFAPLYGFINEADCSSTCYAFLSETNYPNKYCGETFNFLGTEYPYNLFIPQDWVGYMRFTLNVQDCSYPAGINFADLLTNYPPYPFDTITVVNDLNTISCITQIDVSAYIEGPFDPAAGSMKNSLNNENLLPLDQPYNTAPWDYTGSEMVSSIPAPDVVDWVLVELRETPTNDPSTATGSTMIARRAGFLLSNGSIVDTDGTTPLQFSVVINDYVFAVVRHRNHLAIISNYSLQETGGVYTYDFSSGADQVYGGSNAHKEVAPGIWAMVACDGDADGNVSNSDKNNVWMPSAGLLGYMAGDFNLDAFVENADKNTYWYPNSGKGSGVPESGYNTFVPK